MSKLILVLSILVSLAGCAGTPMSGSPGTWDQGTLSGAGND